MIEFMFLCRRRKKWKETRELERKKEMNKVNESK
jgi:hypothetical protein